MVADKISCNILYNRRFISSSNSYGTALNCRISYKIAVNITYFYYIRYAPQTCSKRSHRNCTAYGIGIVIYEITGYIADIALIINSTASGFKQTIFYIAFGAVIDKVACDVAYSAFIKNCSAFSIVFVIACDISDEVFCYVTVIVGSVVDSAAVSVCLVDI